MKRMWAKENVNKAIEEYMEAHPQGGKVYLHNMSIKFSTSSLYFQIYSNSSNPFTNVDDIRNFYGDGTNIPVAGTYYGSSKIGVLMYGVLKANRTFEVHGMQIDTQTNVASGLSLELGSAQAISDSVKEL